MASTSVSNLLILGSNVLYGVNRFRTHFLGYFEPCNPTCQPRLHHSNELIFFQFWALDWFGYGTFASKRKIKFLFSKTKIKTSSILIILPICLGCVSRVFNWEESSGESFFFCRLFEIKILAGITWTGKLFTMSI